MSAKAAGLGFLARDLARSKAYEFCWTSPAKVFVRKNTTSPITNATSSSSHLILYKWDHSPPSNAVRTVGSILGLQFELIELDRLTRAYKTPEFKKINPASSLPVLKDGDFILSESNSVILYLVEKYGGEHKAKLYPSDIKTRALVHQILFYNSFIVFPKVKDIAKSRIRGGSTGPTAEDVANIASVFTIVEAFLQKHPYTVCDHLTVADVALGTTVAAANLLVPFDAERFPKIQAWLDRLMENTHFRKLRQVGATGFQETIERVKQMNKKSE